MAGIASDGAGGRRRRLVGFEGHRCHAGAIDGEGVRRRSRLAGETRVAIAVAIAGNCGPGCGGGERNSRSFSRANPAGMTGVRQGGNASLWSSGPGQRAKAAVISRLTARTSPRVIPQRGTARPITTARKHKFSFSDNRAIFRRQGEIVLFDRSCVQQAGKRVMDIRTPMRDYEAVH